MKYLKQNRYGLCALAIITFALLLRILLVSLGWPPTNSDEGTMGIMALHIAYHGEHPVLYYGQNYMGAIEAYLGAFFFHLFWASLFTLRLGTLLLFSLFLASTYLLTSLLYTKKFALVVLILLSLGSNAMFVWEIYAKGGSTQTLLFGSLSFLFAAWLALSRGQNLSAGRRWLRYACYGGWGLAIGLGLWSDMIVVPYFVMSALLLILFCWRDLRSWAPLCLLLGFAIGMLPLIIYNLKAPPGLDSLSVFLALFHGTQTHTLRTTLIGIVKTVGVSIPTVTGIPACPVPALSYVNNVNPPNTLCSTLYKGWGTAYLLLWATATLLVMQSLWKLRPRYRLLNLAQFTAKQEFTAKQKAITVRVARFSLLASAGLALASYAVSSAPIGMPASHGRYLIGLLIITPAVLWPLWRAASHIKLPSLGPIMLNNKLPSKDPITLINKISSRDPITLNNKIPSKDPITLNNKIPSKDPITLNNKIPSKDPITLNNKIPSKDPITLNNKIPSKDPITLNNKIPRTPVGADLSSPPPIYRPSGDLTHPDTFVNDHDRFPVYQPLGTLASPSSGEETPGPHPVGTLASPPSGEETPGPQSVGAGEERRGVGTLASPASRENTTPWSAWLSAAILLLIGISFLAGTIGITGEFPATQAFNQQQDALIHDLIRLKITHIYTDYWTCNRVAFVSNEQIICGVIGRHLEETHNRDMRYWFTVSSDPHSAYVLPPDHYSLPTLEKKVAAAGGDKAYQRFFLDGYIVYEPR